MSIRSPRSELVWVPLLCAAAAIIFLWEYLSPPPGQYLGGDDVVWQLIQAWRLAQSELAAGHLPLWNPYLFAGTPLLANPQPAFLYPPNWTLFIPGLPLNVGLAWLSAFHLAWAMGGMYLWARGEGLRPGSALVAAATLAYCGFMVVRVADGHPNFVATLSWLPWAMAAFRRAMRRPTLPRTLLAGAPLALAFYAGNPPGALLVAGLPSLLLGAELLRPANGKRDWRLLRVWLLAGAFAIGLSAAQLLPAAELILQSARAGQADYTFATEFSLPVPHLISLLIPNFFGEPVRTGYWGEGRHTEFILYPGLVALALAVLTVRSHFPLARSPTSPDVGRSRETSDSERRVLFWLAVAIGGLLLALGPAGGLHPIAYRLLPPLRLVRAPVRFGYWSIFAVATLAGFGVENFARAGRQSSNLDADFRPPGVAFLAPLLLAILLAVGSVGALVTFRLAIIPDADRLYHLGAATLRSAFVLALIAGLFLLAARWRWSGRAFAAGALALTLMDLWGYGGPLLRLTEEGYDPTWREAAQYVESDDRVLPWGLFLFFHNGGMDHGLSSVFGYDPIILRRYEQFTISVQDPRARTFDLLNARYLLAHEDQEFGPEAQPTLIARAGDYALFERADYLPRAWMVFQVDELPAEEQITRIHSPEFDPRAVGLVAKDPGCELPPSAHSAVPSAPLRAGPGGGFVAAPEAGLAQDGDGSEGNSYRKKLGSGGATSVDVVRGEPGRVELVVSSDAPGVLILSEQHYAGWRASVDGQPARVFAADVVLQGVCVPAGAHRVQFEFAPGSLWAGVGLTLVTTLLGILLILSHPPLYETIA